MTSEAPVLRIAHVAAGRARLKLDCTLTAKEIAAFADRLAGCDGITRARIRPATGSVILETDIPAADVVEHLSAEGIARVLARRRPPPVSQTLRSGLLGGDSALRRRSDGALDLHSAIVLLLILAAILQILRGRYAGPATTLLLSALSLVEKPGPGR